MIDEERWQFIKYSLQAFDFNDLQDCMSLLETCRYSKITISEFAEYVMENVQLIGGSHARYLTERKYMAKYAYCPECNSGLVFDPLGHTNCTIVTDDVGVPYRSVATCKDEERCGWQVYGYDSTSELAYDFFPEKIRNQFNEVLRTPHGEDIQKVKQPCDTCSGERKE